MRLRTLVLAVLVAAPTRAAAQRADTPPSGAIGAVTPEASAEDVPLTPEQQERARALESDLKCPVCRSQSIHTSQSFMAEDMRRRVRQLVAEGRSDAEIRQYFVDRYGTWVLLTPPMAGFNLTAYLIPFLAVLVGAGALVLALRRWRRRAGGRDEALGRPPASPYLTRLERELEDTE